MVEGISNEFLEQQIASFYVEGARRAPGRVVVGSVLSQLWCEFDRRVSVGLIVVE